jgi:hypothetical protein
MSEKMDEMVRTYFADRHKYSPRTTSITTSEMVAAGLRAVLEAHVKPMLAKAFRDGEASAEGAETCEVAAEADRYSDRIIADLTKDKGERA